MRRLLNLIYLNANIIWLIGKTKKLFIVLMTGKNEETDFFLLIERWGDKIFLDLLLQACDFLNSGFEINFDIFEFGLNKYCEKLGMNLDFI